MLFDIKKYMRVYNRKYHSIGKCYKISNQKCKKHHKFS